MKGGTVLILSQWAQRPPKQKNLVISRGSREAQSVDGYSRPRLVEVES